VITLRHNAGARYAIAGIALAILLSAIAFSKRKTQGMMDDAAQPAEVAPAAAAE
jgi:hypothetical protein